MTFAFKLSKRLAPTFLVLGAAAALGGCAGQLTDPIGSSQSVKTIAIYEVRNVRDLFGAAVASGSLQRPGALL